MEEDQEVSGRNCSIVFIHCLPTAQVFPTCTSPGPYKYLGSSLKSPFSGGISRNTLIQHPMASPGSRHRRTGKEQLLGEKPAFSQLEHPASQSVVWEGLTSGWWEVWD